MKINEYICAKFQNPEYRREVFNYLIKNGEFSTEFIDDVIDLEVQDNDYSLTYDDVSVDMRNVFERIHKDFQEKMKDDKVFLSSFTVHFYPLTVKMHRLPAYDIRYDSKNHSQKISFLFSFYDKKTDEFESIGSNFELSHYIYFKKFGSQIAAEQKRNSIFAKPEEK